MATKIQKYGWFPEFVISIVYLVSKFVFSKVYHYFPDGKVKKLDLPYPTVYFANHVAESDIPALSSVHMLVKSPRVKYTIPTREDMIQKNFLVKEFRPKGIAKLLLHFIDKTNILPALFKIVGAVPVKRPFRDNARALLKEGSMRDQVEKDWQVLADNIEKGRNVVIFPEGAFSDDGYLRQVKNGIAYLSKKRDDLNFFYFNFTYDYLSRKKPSVHINFGEIFHVPHSLQKEEIAANIKERLGKLFVVTPGNLLSFFVLTTEDFVGKTRDWIKDRVYEYATAIKKIEGISIAEGLLNGKDSQALDKILDLMISKKIISLAGSGTLNKGSRYDDEKSGEKVRNYKKERPFLYHRNQLKFHEKTISGAINLIKENSVLHTSSVV
ncbi:1-acyl-sn-glycerol-3-phosphate acyltransferase [Leptospira sp. GIMC2001]|uniref:1-acyl-sn-glycerol-3-phosphate acyltransferase n=1 Tax=Leptospira sp. GIMC2001 TaxID=1513297 RepID=UPI00234B121A|nr:1-acyl-sn-glycerol-3-phosphate acyltransferase [Leptospira sp. GIMC2001]WCL47678.1 1-acyl-sn-glycerol-3-phosphate acyltransferase [Leptospira sp. GIMC2001]